MKKRLRIVLILAVALTLVALLRARTRNVEPDGAIRLSGNIEATETRLGFSVQGRLAERCVSEGQTVTNGQVVARLVDTELRQDLALRRAEARAAEAVLAELNAGARPEEVQQAEAALEAARAERKRADAEFMRQKELLENKVTAPREFETVNANRETAAARVHEAEARLALLRQGTRRETLAAALARADAAREAAALAATRCAYAEVRAPTPGVILAECAQAGEFLAPGAPVVTLGDLHEVWLRGYVAEEALGRLKIGQDVAVTTDSHPGKTYPGRLAFIADEAEFTPKSIQTPKERVRLVYRIRIAIPNPELELKRGMPADARIETR